jgi:hypothetical protein
MITEDDIIFSVTNTKDEEGIITRLFHIDFVNYPGNFFDFPLSDKNARQLRKVFSNLSIQERNES